MALIITISVGCREPVGLPGNRVHAASTVVETCYVASDTALAGHVNWYQTSRTISYYTRSNPLIRRAFTDSAGLAHPLTNGFCAFEVPDFDSHGNIPSCTLHYYQSSHSGSADLRINHLSSITSWNPSDEDLFWAAWDDEPIMATDVAQGTDGWHTVPLTAEGCGVVFACAGEKLYAGWTYRGGVSGTYANVTGSGANAPFIIIVYDDNE